MNTRSFIAAGTLLLAALGCQKDAESPTELTPPEAGVVATTALAFQHLRAGGSHTCGVTTEFQTYCWGSNTAGELGVGTYDGPETCIDEWSCSTRPVAVVGGLRFRSVTVGAYYSCGVTKDDRAYCWGENSYGQLGNGTLQLRAVPTAVAGGIRFRQVEPGDGHTCGVSTADQAYCWGANYQGQLGDGTRINRSTPVRVAGGRAFGQVSAGGDHTCGLTISNRAFCWGSNQYGQIGDSTTVARRLRPSQVAGTRQFRQLVAGTYHTCGATTDNRIYCWGDGQFGQIGDGTTKVRFWPRRVAGTLSFARVTAARFHSCAETSLKRVYCWGANLSGQLGIGTDTGPQICNGWDCSTRPVAVTGGLYFVQVSAGSGNHTCGRTAQGVGYCWGSNDDGEVGNGRSLGVGTPVPTAVLSP